MLVSLLLSSFLSQERGLVSSWICWFLFVLAGGPVLVFSLLSFLRKRFLFHHGFPGSSCFGLGFRCLPPFFDLFQGQLCLFSRKSHGFVLALLFSRENSLYHFWICLKINDLHSVWIPGCVGASLLSPRICTVEVMKE